VRTLARLIGGVREAGPDPMRAAQLEILRNAVASGRYEPDLHEVAKKLLAEAFATCRAGRRV
jgi:anti-sigma28 factor (negative regulator of flagellin synthesis)